jgi:ankyrin repeat protein
MARLRKERENNIGKFPELAGILHDIVKALDLQSNIESKLSRIFSIKNNGDTGKIKRFWNGKLLETDEDTDSIIQGIFKTVYNELSGTENEIPSEMSAWLRSFCNRYNLITVKVPTYNANQKSLYWALASRFFVPFFAEFLVLADSISKDILISEKIIGYLDSELPIRLAFEEFCTDGAGCEMKTSVILNKLLESDKSIEPESTRKRLDRLKAGRRPDTEYTLKKTLSDILKAFGREDEKIAKWIRLFRIAMSVSWFREKMISDKWFGKEYTVHLKDFFVDIYYFCKNQKPDLKFDPKIPYLMGLEANEEGNSVLHNMMDSDLYNYGKQPDLWDLPAANYDWLLWDDDEGLSVIFLKFFEEQSGSVQGAKNGNFYAKSPEQASSDYLRGIGKLNQEPTFLLNFEMALLSERLYGTGKAVEFLKSAYKLSKKDEERFWVLLYQLHCLCDLKRKKSPDEEKEAENIFNGIKQIKPLFDINAYLVAFYEARSLVLKNRIKKSARKYKEALKLAKNQGGIVYKKIIKEGALAAAKAEHTKTIFNAFYREGYWKYVFLYPFSQSKDFIMESTRKKFYKYFSAEAFYQSVEQDKVKQDSSNLLGILDQKYATDKWKPDLKNPNKKITDYGATRFTYPLSIAAGWGMVKEVRQLIESGADVNKCNSNDESALLENLLETRDKTAKLEIANMILDHGVSKKVLNQCSKKKKNSPLSAAIEYGAEVEIVERLIELGVELNEKVTAENMTPLYLAISQLGAKKTLGNMNIADLKLHPDTVYKQTFVRSRCDFLPSPVFVDNLTAAKNSMSPADFISNPDLFKMTKVLTQYMIDQINPDAIRKIIYLLICAKVDLEKPNKHNHTVLTFASELKETGIVKKLLKAGANVNAKTDRNGNALHYAIDPGPVLTDLVNSHRLPYKINEPCEEYPELVQMLVGYGAETELQNRDYLTPLDMAYLFKQSKVIQILEPVSKSHDSIPQELFEKGLEWEKRGPRGWFKAMATYMRAVEKGHFGAKIYLDRLFSAIPVSFQY